MSKFRMKWAIAGALLLMASTQVSWGQISEMRLFSPYPDDQFGGGAYAREGLYGSIGAGLIAVTLPSTREIGFDRYGNNEYGEQPWYVTNEFAGVYTMARMGNQMNTSEFKSRFSNTTEFEIGRQIGHQGWQVRSQIVSPYSDRVAGLDASINIYDPLTILASDYIAEITRGNASADYYVFTGVGGGSVGTDSSFSLVDPHSMARIGHLWAIVDMRGNNSSSTEYDNDYSSNNTNNNTNNDSNNESGTDTQRGVYAIVPIPIVYDMYQIETHLNYWSVEAMYNYRFHPFNRGLLELEGGVRYTCFDDDMSFFGHSTTRTSNTYDSVRVQVLSDGQMAASNGGAIGTQSENYAENTETNESFSGADLGYSLWKFEAENHIVGPQVGGRYSLANGRWRFGAEGMFFAGFNRQNIRGYGQFGLKAEADQEGNLSGSNNNSNSSSNNDNDNDGTGGLSTKSPLGTVANRFSYKEYFNQFTPGVEAKIEASWYWTEALSFKVGYQFMYLGNVARGTTVNDYVINPNGTYFRCKDDRDERNTDVLAHGIMFTAQINK